MDDPSPNTHTALERNRFLHLTDLSVKFDQRHSSDFASIKVEVDNDHYKSHRFDLRARDDITWTCNIYFSVKAKLIVTIRDEHQLSLIPKKNRVTVVVALSEVEDNMELTVPTSNRNINFCLFFKDSMPLKRVVSIVGEGVSSALESKVIFLDKIGRVSFFLQGVLDVGNILCDSHPIAKVAFSIVANVFEKCRLQQECHKQALELLDNVVSRLPFTGIIPENMQSEEVRAALDMVLDLIREIFLFLDNYASAPARDDFISSRLGDIINLQKKLQDTSANFNTCVSLVQYRMIHAGRNLQDIESLDKLKPVSTARYNRDKACLEGTRTEILKLIMDWAKSSGCLETLFWIFGLAGSGKSALASTICDQLRQRNMLAGSFFCKRDIPEQREANHILPSLAYGLALVYEPYRQEILKVLEKEPSIGNAEISLQLRLLFMEPIAHLKESIRFDKNSPFVFVVDALDECGDLRTRTLIAGCLTQLAGACDWLKILLTSRPLIELHNKFDQLKCSHSKVMDLSTVSTHNDIYQYTKHSLEEIANNQGLDEKWLADDFVQLLSRKASGLFIWISTVMKYVEGQYDRDTAFNMILAGSVDTAIGLDSLYLKIIRGSRGGSDIGNQSLMRAVLGMIYITAKNKPLTFDALHEFMSMSEGGKKTSKPTLRAVINDLKSVLYEDTSKGDVIRVCHPSLLDFMADKDKSEEFWTDPEILDNEMAIKCLATMDKGLKFNICQLESSHLRNEGIDDLPRRIKKFISETLNYSCSYWIDHVGTVDNEERRMMNKILGGPKVLYWIEVLSLNCELQKCMPKLQYLLKINHDNEAITAAVTDVYKFVSSFGEPISASTPHIYISALTWLPEESYLAKLLHPFFLNQPALQVGREKNWLSSLWVKSMSTCVEVVTFSPNGTKVAAAALDGTISIWEVKTGERMGLVHIDGQSSLIVCLTWTTDGKHFLSNSNNSVCVWDAKSYTVVGDPWEGHTNAVAAIACSPNNQLIASGGYDNIVIIWRADGSRAREPLLGHSQAVKLLAFSSDSEKLASSSDDMTVRLWSLHTGDQLWQILNEYWVNGIVISHDGRLLAAASSDTAIHLWEIETGEPWKEPLVGHFNGVHSVAFSPDDKLIASGSDDLTVCLWDVDTGLQKGRPYRGHSHWVRSVAFSPDGNYVASSANDMTLRLWDVSTNDAVDRVSEELTGMAYNGLDVLQDGSRFITGTEDGAIHVWDATTFTKLKTIEGHTARITSLRYSLDGKYIISASFDYSVRLWDPDSGAQLGLICPPGCYLVNALSPSPDNKHFACAGADGIIRIRDMEKPEEVVETFPRLDQANQGNVLTVCYSKDGTLLASGGDDKSVTVWRTNSSASYWKCLEGHGNPVTTVVFSMDAGRLVSGDEGGNVRIWDVKTGDLLHLIEWHIDQIYSITVSPDDTRFATASRDKFMNTWDFQTGKRVGEALCGHSGQVSNAVYTPDGKTIISVSDDSTIRVWDAAATQKNYVAELDLSLSYLNLDDGWITDKEDGLVLWVPPEQRNGIKDVCIKCIPDNAVGHPVKLDWSKFIMRGTWTDILKEI